MIPKSFVQELLGRVDIVDVIESCFPLKRAGANLTACCPFHNEKSPSFTVSPSKQFYHCFGCGAHGSAIGFLMEYSGLSFVEAVKDLAERAGLQVPETAPSRPESAATRTSENPDALLDVLHRAAAFFKAELKASERAVAYLKSRGVTGEMAGRFALGYAPAGWQGLASVFADYADRRLVDAGLVIQGEEGKRYDRFRDRIMFPIVSQRGQVIGFGGRVLDKSEPKYLNSPETPLFEKGRELYGLFQARQGIRAAGRVIVVEGYMDVVALAQYGVACAVATLGTATTSTHVQKLLRQTDEVVFCFDGDAAGRRAAWRALENALGHLQDGKQVKFLFLPPEHDPDSYVREKGEAAFVQAVSQAVPLSEFLLTELRSRGNLLSEEGRGAVVEAAKPLVAAINAPILRIGLVDRLAEMIGKTRGEALATLKLTVGHPVSVPSRTARSDKARAIGSSAAYRRLLKCFLRKPELLAQCDAAEFTHPEIEADAARALVAATGALQEAGDVALWLDQVRGTPFASLLLELNNEALSDWGPDFDVEAEFASALQSIEVRSRRQALADLLRAGEREGWTPERKEALLRLQHRPINEEGASRPSG
jgi:DNA primase